MLKGTVLFIIVLASLFAGSTEVSRYKIFLPFLPLYTRLKKEEVLDQFTRGRIYEHIRNYPGDHYNSIKQKLKLNNGAVAYHLRTLERENLIKSKRDGIFKLFYPVEMEIPRKGEVRLSAIQKNIMEKITPKKLIIILAHALVGWALCGAIIGIGFAVHPLS